MSLPDRDPSVPVTLTPDAERITARVEGWIDASDNQHATPKRKAVVRKDVRDRAERGQAKYPPWVTALTRRNPGREMREELTDATWYASAMEDLIDYLFNRVDEQGAQIAEQTARIAELERERDRMLPVFEAAMAIYAHSSRMVDTSTYLAAYDCLKMAVVNALTATQEALHD